MERLYNVSISISFQPKGEPSFHSSARPFGSNRDCCLSSQHQFVPHVLCVLVAVPERKGEPFASMSSMAGCNRRTPDGKTQAFKQDYAQHRSGVEGSLSALTRRNGMRMSKYIGQKKRNLQALFTGCAANLQRTARWLAGHRPQVRHKSWTLRTT
jgi:hypothetical protein